MDKFDERSLFGISKAEPSEHQEHCHKIFNSIKSGANLYVRIDQELSWSKWDIESEQEQYIHISILSDEIIEYDLQLFRAEGQEYILNKYRPYFVQFTVSINNIEQIHKIEEVGTEWRVAKFTTSNVNDEEQGIQCLDGTLETSASPVVCIQGRLLVFQNKAIKQAVLNLINSTYNPNKFSFTSNDDIENVLNNCWDEDYLNTIDIYNVGHGNADYIRGSQKRILYDIGYNYRCYPSHDPHESKYWRAVTAIRHLKPSCVILSHWDSDHIIGCAYSQQSVFNVPWIAPYLVSSKDGTASTNSIRLAHYLHVLGKLYLVDRTQSTQLIATIQGKHNIEMKLWLGKGNSICSVKNREGLFIEILGQLHILLGGDVPYSCMPDILNTKIDYMHVPHHCSRMELSRISTICWKGECAIISTNRLKDKNGNYNLNCNEEHHQKLEKLFKNVIHTIDSPVQNDEENLSIQISYKNKTCYIR